MVAAVMEIETTSVQVNVEGDLDLKGTLGIDRGTRVGFTAIRIHFDVEAPHASAEDIQSLEEKTQKYCVVLATLQEPPSVEMSWGS